MEEEINTDKNNQVKKQNKRYNININTSSPLRLGRSYDNSLNRKEINQNFNSYNVTTENNNRQINLEKYNNIRPVTQSPENIPHRCGYKCNSCSCPYIHHYIPHHVHFHHIHLPHNHFCPRLNCDTSYQRIGNNLSDDLINEVAELRNECRKVRRELERTQNENKVGSKYIKLLENKINYKEKNRYKYNDKEDINMDDYDDEDLDNEECENDDENERNNFRKGKNLENRYHNMLNRSFEVLNSVSNKCDDKKGKIKGGVNYYINKDPDYDELIEAQKKWLDNLPEKNSIPRKGDTFNNNYSTFSNTHNTYSKERFNEENTDGNNFDNFNDDNYNDKYYNNMSNFNKNKDNDYNLNNRINFDRNNKYDKYNKYNINNNDYERNLDDKKIPINQIDQNYIPNYNKIGNINSDINNKK